MFDSVAPEFSSESVLGVFLGVSSSIKSAYPTGHIPPMSLTGTVVKAVSFSFSFVRDISWVQGAGDTDVRGAVVLINPRVVLQFSLRGSRDFSDVQRNFRSRPSLMSGGSAGPEGSLLGLPAQAVGGKSGSARWEQNGLRISGCSHKSMAQPSCYASPFMAGVSYRAA